jgi:hypothetical protein
MKDTDAVQKRACGARSCPRRSPIALGRLGGKSQVAARVQLANCACPLLHGQARVLALADSASAASCSESQCPSGKMGVMGSISWLVASERTDLGEGWRGTEPFLQGRLFLGK